MPSPDPIRAPRSVYEQHVADMIAPSDPIKQRAIRRTSLFDVACDGALALRPEQRGNYNLPRRKKAA
jgi:hypothetical protein